MSSSRNLVYWIQDQRWIVFLIIIIKLYLMLDKMSLPSLAEFHAVLKGFNIKKNFQYLLYFAKNQQRMYSLFPDLATSSLKQTDIPSGPDRDFILKHIGDILMMQESVCVEKGKNGENKLSEVLILSAQRFVMGLIMLGHVHIYEILIRELMPTFVKIIQRETYVDHYKSDFQKKIRQFCKETITLLAMWFPKCFYDNSSSSWFKKAVLKYDISVKFIVYFTNDKIEQYEKTIMELRLNQSKTECTECKHCLEMSGKNYNFLRNIPEIPSIIEEEEHEGGSSIRYNKKKPSLEKKKPSYADSGSKSSNNYSNIPLESKIGGMQYQAQVSDFEEKQSSSSKLSERIRKHREARKQKGRKSLIKNSLRSRMEYFNQKSKISQQNAEEEKERKEYSTSHSKNIYRGKQNGAGDVNDNEDSESNDLRQSLRGALSEENLSSVKNGYQRFKDKQKNKYKFLNKGFGSSRSKREPSTEKVLPTYHSTKEDVYEISPNQQAKQQSKHSYPSSTTHYEKNRVFCISVFESEIYRVMQKTRQKLFRKECCKVSKKRLVSTDEPWTLEIKCKPKGKKMELKIDLMSEYANTIEATLIQPKHSEILMKEGKNIFYFNFQRGFLPITFRIGKEQVLLPITLISMLEPLERRESWEEKESELSQMSNSSSYITSEIQFKLDSELFQTVYHIAKTLKFSEQEINVGMKRGSLTKKYLFFGEMILIGLEEFPESDGLVRIKIHHKELKNDEKVFLVLKEMKKCAEKSSSGVRKVKKNEKAEGLKSEKKIIYF